jgi:hypothetical protein
VNKDAESDIDRSAHRFLSPRARLYLQAIIVLLVSLHAIQWTVDASWRWGGDMDAYWNAAVRLATGQPLFPELHDVNAHSVYRYSAWFAAAWIPLTHLPRDVVTNVWVGLMLISAVALLAVAGSRRSLAGWLLVVLMAPVLIQSAWYGQVQPLLVLGLVWGLGRPSGPAWIGVAMSMKLLPILLIVIYLPDREIRKAAFAVGIGAALTLPTMFFDLSHYPIDAGVTASFWQIAPALWAAFALASIAVATWVANRWPHLAVVAAGSAVILASPRIYLDYTSYLLPALRWRRD